jgi:hypothetical protein
VLSVVLCVLCVACCMLNLHFPLTKIVIPQERIPSLKKNLKAAQNLLQDHESQLEVVEQLYNPSRVVEMTDRVCMR